MHACSAFIKPFVNDNDNRCISGVFGWDFGFD